MTYNTLPNKNKISVNILVNNKPIEIHEHNSRRFIEGRKKSKYSIEIKNDNNTLLKKMKVIQLKQIITQIM